MTKREIYLEAARRIADGRDRYACCAIDTVLLYESSGPRREFGALFRPSVGEGAIWPGWLECINDKPGEARHRRVIALCLMAAISE